MNKSFSGILTTSPEIVTVNSLEKKQQSPVQYPKPNEQIVSLQMRSSVSERRRHKLPETMKQFLKERHQVREKISLKRQQSKKSLKSKNSAQNETELHFYEREQMKSAPNNEQIEQVNVQQQQRKSTVKLSRNARRRNKNINVIKQIPAIICSICQGELTPQLQISAFKCRHIFCEQCLRSYAKYKISMFEEVYCPEQSCNATLDSQTVFFKKMTKKQRRLYKKIHNFYLTQTDPSNKLCPKQECQGVIKIQQEAETQQCDTCKKIFCSNCFLEAHEGACKEYEVKFMEDNLHYRQCQRCKIVVQRTEGCNHMTCKCGYQFCYMCGGKWRHDHLCRPIEQDGEDGCDWGESTQDHIIFLLKLPLKFILITLYTVFWVVASFSAAPYNLFFFLYWLVLIFVGGACVFICQDERQLWQVMLLLLVFPILMIICVPMGVRLFLERFDEECSYIADGYRWIVRL